MVTSPPAFTDGRTESCTPVSLKTKLPTLAVTLLTMVVPRLIGTWLPTAMLAVWLSSTITEGVEIMLTRDSSLRALSTAEIFPLAFFIVYEKPGTLAAMALGLSANWPRPLWRLRPFLNTHCRPYFNSSVNCTSIMLASIITCVATTSSSLRASAMISYWRPSA